MCVLISYMNGDESRLQTTVFLRSFSWQFYLTLRVFSERLLRKNRKRHTVFISDLNRGLSVANCQVFRFFASFAKKLLLKLLSNKTSSCDKIKFKIFLNKFFNNNKKLFTSLNKNIVCFIIPSKRCKITSTEYTGLRYLL